MTVVIKKFAKAPSEKLDYAIEYGKELIRLGDTIASSRWIIPSNTVDAPGNQAVSLDDGVTVNYSESSPSPVFSQGGTLFTDTKATIYLSGGTLAQEYILENRIITAAGRKYSRRIIIVVQAK